MHEPIVRLVYERTSPPGVDAGVEPLIAVCATEEAESVSEASSARGRYASWEHHPLRDAAGRTAPVDGEMTHVVLIGDVEAEPRDPIGIAVYTDRSAAERAQPTSFVEPETPSTTRFRCPSGGEPTTPDRGQPRAVGRRPGVMRGSVASGALLQHLAPGHTGP